MYSNGHLIFGHNHTDWTNDQLTRITLTTDAITRVEILPLAGEGNDLAQPYLLKDKEARKLLENIQARSAKIDTRMEIEGEIGVIIPAQAHLH